MSVGRSFRKFGRCKKKKLIKPLSPEKQEVSEVSTAEEKPAEEKPIEKEPVAIAPTVRASASPSSLPENSASSGGKTPLRVSLKKPIDSEVSVSSGNSSFEATPRQNPFTQQDLIKFWDKFAQDTKEPDIRSMFQYCRPTLKDDFRIGITVINPEQERRFGEELMEIKRYLADLLQNDLILFDIQVKESDIVDRPFTNKEKFEYLLKKNPDLGLLVSEFNLRLD